MEGSVLKWREVYRNGVKCTEMKYTEMEESVLKWRKVTDIEGTQSKISKGIFQDYLRLSCDMQIIGGGISEKILLL